MLTWLDHRTIVLGFAPVSEWHVPHTCCGFPCRGNAAWDCARRAAESDKPAAMMRVVDPLGGLVDVLVWATEGRASAVDILAEVPALRAWFPSIVPVTAAAGRDHCLKSARFRVSTGELLMVSGFAGNERPADGEPTVPERLASAGRCIGCEGVGIAAG